MTDFLAGCIAIKPVDLSMGYVQIIMCFRVSILMIICVFNMYYICEKIIILMLLTNIFTLHNFFFQ